MIPGREERVMQTFPSSPASPSESLLKAAREVWALACWAALRMTWKEWEKSRGAEASKRGPVFKLPPLVERFFGLYCHEKYVKWIPFVVAETVTRAQRQRDQRKKTASKKDDDGVASLHEQWAGLELTSGELADAEPVIQQEELSPSEVVEGVLVEEREGLASDDAEDADPGFDDTDWQSSRGLDLPPLDFSTLHIEVPSRPNDSEDRAVWEAWHRTLSELLAPTKKKRVLMNELFKQATNPEKKTGTAEEVLRCLTGYLKAITREAVRREAKFQRMVISNAKVGSLDAPLPGSDTAKSFTGGDVMAGSASTASSVEARELEALGEGLAKREYDRLQDTPGVKLGHFTTTLRKQKGKAGDKGFTVGIQDPAILITLGYKPDSKHLYDLIKASQQRLKQAAIAIAPGEGEEVHCATEAYARQELMRLCTEWFWSEEISHDLFSIVIALIHADKDPGFFCPHATRCTSAPATVDRQRCWSCPRKALS